MHLSDGATQIKCEKSLKKSITQQKKDFHFDVKRQQLFNTEIKHSLKGKTVIQNKTQTRKTRQQMEPGEELKTDVEQSINMKKIFLSIAKLIQSSATTQVRKYSSEVEVDPLQRVHIAQ